MTVTAWKRRPVDAFWVQNDSAPTLTEQLLDGNGNPVNLGGATVRFLAWLPGAASAQVSAAATIVDAPTGTVSFTPTPTHTAKIGDLMVEWQVTFGGGAVETFAGASTQKVRVRKDLGT